MDFVSVLTHYWKYYLELENDFLDTSKYVAFEERNGAAYSLEFLKLFQAACSEVDTLGKVLAKIVNPDFNVKKPSIKNWWFEVQDVELFAIDFWKPYRVRLCEVVVLHEGWGLRPWQGYHYDRVKTKSGADTLRLSGGASARSWWADYNDVKHSRIALAGETMSHNFVKANLSNTMNAFAGLYILERSLISRIGNVDELQGFIDESRLFAPRMQQITMSDIDAIFV